MGNQLHSDLVLFLLRDTICGIVPTDLPHVFEKFYHGQGRPGEKARRASGLGLYTCKLLVEKHGGTIAIQNRPVGGCEVAFSLSLPPGGQCDVGAGEQALPDNDSRCAGASPDLYGR